MTWVYIVGIFIVIIGAGAFFGAPYVPSRRRDVRRMFDTLYPLSKQDVVFDAGSGDGLILREVSRRGASAVGYEFNPIFWAISKAISSGYKRVSIKLANFWIEPFPDDVTMVYAFTVTRDGKKLLKKITRERERLGRSLTIICYGSPLPGVKPTKSYEAYNLYEF